MPLHPHHCVAVTDPLAHATDDVQILVLIPVGPWVVQVCFHAAMYMLLYHPKPGRQCCGNVVQAASACPPGSGRRQQGAMLVMV